MKISSKRLATLASKLAWEKKALDVKILDLRKLSSMCDYFVICSASVELHARAVADWVTENLEKKGVKIWHKEGYSFSRWILLDYVDVVVHVFLPEVREFYQLEKLWGDAPTLDISEPNQSLDKFAKKRKK